LVPIFVPVICRYFHHLRIIFFIILPPERNI
jgi:hypothetical protein